MKKFIISIVFGILAANQSHADDWFTKPSAELRNQSGWEAVAYCTLSEIDEARYVKILHRQKAIEIGHEEATQLCGSQGVASAKQRAYIVRALVVGKYTGVYCPKLLGLDVWINHESLAHRDARATKSALLVFLDHPFDNLYVTAYADE